MEQWAEIRRLHSVRGLSMREIHRRTGLHRDTISRAIHTWFAERANVRHHKTLRCRPVDRLAEEQEVMARLPAEMPHMDRRWVIRVPPDPHLRFDTCDYSLDPQLVGRRVEARVTPTEVLAVALETGELACRHQRSFARHRTITDLAHA